jgi:hypothetical protein
MIDNEAAFFSAGWVGVGGTLMKIFTFFKKIKKQEKEKLQFTN